jgi:hypothetical protein
MGFYFRLTRTVIVREPGSMQGAGRDVFRYFMPVAAQLAFEAISVWLFHSINIVSIVRPAILDSIMQFLKNFVVERWAALFGLLAGYLWSGGSVTRQAVIVAFLACWLAVAVQWVAELDQELKLVRHNMKTPAE